MAYYIEEPGEYAVTPMLVAPCSTECCEPPPLCYPTLPRCPKQVIYYCEKPQSVKSHCDVCCEEIPVKVKESRKQQQLPTKEPLCPTCKSPCKPAKTKYVIPCYRYEDGRIVRKLPVSAFKRNGMQDQEHSKLLGTANFLKRCPRDVAIECEVNEVPVNVRDPVKVPPYRNPLNCGLLKKEPIEVLLEDVNQPTVLMRRACEVAVGARPRRKPFAISTSCVDPDQEVHRYHCQDDRGNCCYYFAKQNKCDPCVSCPRCCDYVGATPVPPPGCYFQCC